MLHVCQLVCACALLCESAESCQMAAVWSWRLCAAVLLGAWLVLLALVECCVLVWMLLASACHVCGASRGMQPVLSLCQRKLAVRNRGRKVLKIKV